MLRRGAQRRSTNGARCASPRVRLHCACAPRQQSALRPRSRRRCRAPSGSLPCGGDGLCERVHQRITAWLLREQREQLLRCRRVGASGQERGGRDPARPRRDRAWLERIAGSASTCPSSARADSATKRVVACGAASAVKSGPKASGRLESPSATSAARFKSASAEPSTPLKMSNARAPRRCAKASTAATRT